MIVMDTNMHPTPIVAKIKYFISVARLISQRKLHRSIEYILFEISLLTVLTTFASNPTSFKEASGIIHYRHYS